MPERPQIFTGCPECPDPFLPEPKPSELKIALYPHRITKGILLTHTSPMLETCVDSRNQTEGKCVVASQRHVVEGMAELVLK